MPPSYALDRTLYSRHDTNTTLHLAHPIMDDVLLDDEWVVIKAAPKAKQDAFTEIAALQLLPRGHPHIAPLLDCMQDEDSIYMVLPYLRGGDLFEKVKMTWGRGLSDAQARHYLRQICEGLLFMKKTAGLAHHDVSLENVMVDEEDVVRIIDLGMAIRVPASAKKGGRGGQMIIMRSKHFCGKMTYLPP